MLRLRRIISCCCRVLNQLPSEKRERLREIMHDCSNVREIVEIACDYLQHSAASVGLRPAIAKIRCRRRRLRHVIPTVSGSSTSQTNVYTSAILCGNVELCDRWRFFLFRDFSRSAFFCEFRIQLGPYQNGESCPIEPYHQSDGCA